MGFRKRLTIRSAEARDVDGVTAIERIAFSEPRWPASAFRSLVSEEQSEFLVAVVEGADGEEVAGYVVVVVAGEDADVANLAVAPGRRRHGVGGRLLERAIQVAESRGVRRLFLEVRDSNHAAIELYSTRAFRVVGRRTGYYSHPREDALILRLDIDDPARGEADDGAA